MHCPQEPFRKIRNQSRATNVLTPFRSGLFQGSWRCAQEDSNQTKRLEFRPTSSAKRYGSKQISQNTQRKQDYRFIAEVSTAKENNWFTCPAKSPGNKKCIGSISHLETFISFSQRHWWSSYLNQQKKIFISHLLYTNPSLQIYATQTRYLPNSPRAYWIGQKTKMRDTAFISFAFRSNRRWHKVLLPISWRPDWCRRLRWADWHSRGRHGGFSCSTLECIVCEPPGEIGPQLNRSTASSKKVFKTDFLYLLQSINLFTEKYLSVSERLARCMNRTMVLFFQNASLTLSSAMMPPDRMSLRHCS